MVEAKIKVYLLAIDREHESLAQGRRDAQNAYEAGSISEHDRNDVWDTLDKAVTGNIRLLQVIIKQAGLS